MKSKLFVLVLVVVLTALAATPIAASPFHSASLRDFVSAPCSPGAAYDPACDANQDGAVNVLDVQLTAGHWNQTGTWLSDNSHNHLGQSWTGTDNPLTITGSFGSPQYAPLVLGNGSGMGLVISLATEDGLYVNSAGSAGVVVIHAGGNGVYVSSAGTHGLYVGSAGWDGVHAVSASAGHFGGWFLNGIDGGGGVRAEGGSNEAPDLVLGGVGAEDDGRIYSEPSLSGSDILLYSNDVVQIDLDEDNNSTSSFNIRNGTNATVWTVSETGLAVAGGPNAVQVDAGSHGKRLAYAVTSPQNWIEDFGSGQLQAGQAVIALEAAYAETISAEQPYHVFLTPLGDCPLYVAEKAITSFTVRAMGGAKCTIAFDYRTVALRRGYETVRMERFTEVSDE